MRLRSLFLGLALVAGGMLPVAAGADIACAAEGPRAVLVVDTGSGVHRYCVALGAPRVSGIEVIKLAGKQHGLDYSLGHGGGAVCRLAGVGPDGGDCFAEHPDYWGYWRGGGNGGWTWSSSGASSTSVGDGDVEGWSWGSGDSGATHPAPPHTTFGAVCPKTTSPPPAGKEKPRATAEKGSSSPAAAPSSAPSSAAQSEEVAVDDEGKKKRTRAAGKKRARSRAAVAAASPYPRPSASPTVAAPSASAARAEGGPPTAGLAALAVAVAFGVTGTLLARRRRRIEER